MYKNFIYKQRIYNYKGIIGTYVTINSTTRYTRHTIFNTKIILSDSLQQSTILTSNKILQTYIVTK